MATKKKKTTKRTKKSTSKKASKSKKSSKKKPGVIATIVASIEDAGKKGITKKEILDELTKAFPDRKPDSMMNTIRCQVPSRISKERFKVGKTEDGKYFKK